MLDKYKSRQESLEESVEYVYDIKSSPSSLSSNSSTGRRKDRAGAVTPKSPRSPRDLLLRLDQTNAKGDRRGTLKIYDTSPQITGGSKLNSGSAEPSPDPLQKLSPVPRLDTLDAVISMGSKADATPPLAQLSTFSNELLKDAVQTSATNSVVKPNPLLVAVQNFDVAKAFMPAEQQQPATERSSVHKPQLSSRTAHSKALAERFLIQPEQEGDDELDLMSAQYR